MKLQNQTTNHQQCDMFVCHIFELIKNPMEFVFFFELCIGLLCSFHFEYILFCCFLAPPKFDDKNPEEVGRRKHIDTPALGVSCISSSFVN